jgi:SOS-response transcriptional repressor LexA
VKAAPRVAGGVVQVPGFLVTSPRMFACVVRGDSMTGDRIFDGDLVLIDPGQVPRDGDVVAAWVTWKGVRGLVLGRFRDGGRVLESGNPQYPPMILGPGNGLVVAGLVTSSVSPLKDGPAAGDPLPSPRGPGGAGVPSSGSLPRHPFQGKEER